MTSKYNDKTEIIKRTPKLGDRFEVIKVLGQGTAGIVYHVRDMRFKGKEVALKLLYNNQAFDDKTILRFKEELLIMQRLSHPNLIQAYELIELGDSLAFTMEYVKGCDLGKLLNAKMSNSEIDQIMQQLLDALDTLHKVNICHRDIKLENILLSDDGFVKLSDLGLVKKQDTKGITEAGVLLGTPQYMPPEYIKAGRYDFRSDIYACGVVLYELITGRRRLSDKPGVTVIEHLIRTGFAFEKISFSGKDSKYQKILEIALSPSPDSRFQRASEMRAAFSSRKFISNLPSDKVVTFGTFSKRTAYAKFVLKFWLFLLIVVAVFVVSQAILLSPSEFEAKIKDWIYKGKSIYMMMR